MENHSYSLLIAFVNIKPWGQKLYSYNPLNIKKRYKDLHDSYYSLRYKNPKSTRNLTSMTYIALGVLLNKLLKPLEGCEICSQTKEKESSEQLG